MPARYICENCGATIPGDDPVMIENFALAARVTHLEEKLRARGSFVDEIGETLP